MQFKKNTALLDKIADLEAKLERRESAVVSFKNELQKLSAIKIERDIYAELSSALATARTSNEMYSHVLEIFTKYFVCTYSGVFKINPEGTHFSYLLGNKYNPSLMSALPINGSLMGECVYNHKILWEPDLRARHDYIPLNQVPTENSILCVPLVLFGKDDVVFRFANLDKKTIDLAIRVLNILLPLVSAGIERIKLNELNEKTRRGLTASFSIAKSLENTLIEKDILKNLCVAIPSLFSCYGCVVAVINRDREIEPGFVYPSGFNLGGSPASHVIYLKNLLSAYPNGAKLIKNIHKERRWSWPDLKAHSLCSTPLRISGRISGLVIAVGGPLEVYNSTHCDLLGLAATQASLTLERATYLRKQEDLARLDGLTNLLNHRVFQEKIREEINRALRYQKTLSIIMFDIDHFKKFNDTHGHPIGDEVLKMVALTIKGVVRNTDMAFRYGGEEFVIILPETPVTNAVQVAERLRQKVSINRSVRNLSVTISLGVTSYRTHESAESFIKRVDNALYDAKNAGRNTIREM